MGKKRSRNGQGNTKVNIKDGIACRNCRRSVMRQRPRAADYKKTLICHAADVGHHLCIQNLVKSGIDVNAKIFGFTPLRIAITANRADCVDVLIKAGACLDDLDTMPAAGITPLMLVVKWNCNERLLRLLLDAGADVNKSSYNGNTPLFIAVQENNITFVKLIIDAGANVNEINKGKATPLTIAVQKGYTECFESLLAAGADLNMKDSKGRTALMAFASVGNNDAVKLLLREGADVNITDLNGQTALTCATAKGHADIVKALLDADVDENKKHHGNAKKNSDDKACRSCMKHYAASIEPHIRAKLKDNRNAILLHAASVGHLQCVKKLVRSGVDVKVAPFGVSPLNVAVDSNNIECVNVLIKGEADLNTINQAGITPLITAIVNNPDDRCLRLLLHNGADVNKTDSCGTTPLMFAVENNKINIIKILINKQAKVNRAHDKDGATPLITAAKNGFTECVYELLAQGADVHKGNDAGVTPFHASINPASNNECRLALLKTGSNVNCKTKKGNFPLIAAIGNTTELVNFLLDHGADVNMKNNQGVSALMAAASRGDYKTAKFLLQKGADVNSTDDNGNTALLTIVYCFNKDKWYDLYRSSLQDEASGYFNMILRRRASETEENETQRTESMGSYLECVKALLSSGANVNIVNTHGVTPLSYATSLGIREFVTVLQEAAAHTRSSIEDVD